MRGRAIGPSSPAEEEVRHHQDASAIMAGKLVVYFIGNGCSPAHKS
jgi:hypothetical protein